MPAGPYLLVASRADLTDVSVRDTVGVDSRGIGKAGAYAANESMSRISLRPRTRSCGKDGKDGQGGR